MSTPSPVNQVRALRQQQGWSQAELAEHAGISRAAVSAIEAHRLVPSVAAALALAHVLGVTVELLFGGAADAERPVEWAWEPPQSPWRAWQAEVSGRHWLYPVERTGELNGPHDILQTREPKPTERDQELRRLARETLVLATCDPAAGFLATQFERVTGMRMIVLVRSSGAALELLREGKVHVAGMHFAHHGADDENAKRASDALAGDAQLLCGARWQAGVTYNGPAIRSVRTLVQGQRRWVGREAGAAARICLDHLLPRGRTVEHVAADHRGVVAAIRAGWADAGVCVRLVSEEASLNFLPVQDEQYDMCFRASQSDDRRLQALLHLVQSPIYRQLLAELPGYDSRPTGEQRECSP